MVFSHFPTRNKKLCFLTDTGEEKSYTILKKNTKIFSSFRRVFWIFKRASKLVVIPLLRYLPGVPVRWPFFFIQNYSQALTKANGLSECIEWDCSVSDDWVECRIGRVRENSFIINDSELTLFSSTIFIQFTSRFNYKLKIRLIYASQLRFMPSKNIVIA